jgi:DNA-binding GntR family transcriptional regulator
MNYCRDDLDLEISVVKNSGPSKRATERQALPDELAKYLRDMIIGGELRPGHRVNTPRLCSRFGVSRTPLREALKMLAAEGLVQLRPNRSAVIQRVSGDMINELVPIVGCLEALAGRIACQRIDAATLGDVEAMYHHLLSCLDQHDERSFIEADKAILRTVLAVAGNATLSRLLETLMIKLRWQTAYHHAQHEWDRTVELQKQSRHALQIRDGDLWALVAQRYVLHRATLLLRDIDGTASAKSRRPRPRSRLSAVVRPRG